MLVDIFGGRPICPSPLHVALCTGKFTNGAELAPQNANFTGCGAYTGEMAAEQMVDMGIRWVLLGHSERRGEFGITHKESEALLAAKLAHVLDQGLSAVFCIGEPLSVRKKGLDATVAYCITQLEQITGLMDPAKVVIAYEPVWAIGTGKVATPDQAEEVHAYLRKWLKDNVSEKVSDSVRIQYGGSVNDKNSEELGLKPNIDGFLVGGASLKGDAFATIINSVKAKLAAA